MLRIKECTKCGGTMRLGIINYPVKVYNRDIIIDNIEGYQCPNCGNIEPSEEVESYLEEKIFEKKSELLSELKIRPIYISNLKEIREKKGLSQRQVANVLGVAEQRFSAIERNVNTPTILITYALAHFFDVSSDDLYEMIYVSEKFYNKLLNLELIKTKNGVEFNYVEEAEKARNGLSEIRDKIENINKELMKYRLKLKKGEIGKKEGEAGIQAILKIKEEELTPVKKSLEKKLKSLEKKYDFIVKQNHIISREDWNEIEKHYKKELEGAISQSDN